MLGLVITTDGKMYKKDFREPLYSSAEPILGGLFENVNPMYLQEPFCFLVNESGLLKGLPLNPIGCAWYQGEIAGNIIVLKRAFTSSGPDVVGLTEEECDTVINLVYEFSDEDYRLVKDPAHGVL